MITFYIILEGLKKIFFFLNSVFRQQLRGRGERSKIITIIFIREDPVVQSASSSARGFHRHPVGCR